MTDCVGAGMPGGLRLDCLLVYLRFARTRSAARAMIEAHALRRNRKHVLRASEIVCIGDVLTVAVGNEIRVIEVLSLPQRRASAVLAKSHYREFDRSDLDPKAQIAKAATLSDHGAQPN